MKNKEKDPLAQPGIVRIIVRKALPVLAVALWSWFAVVFILGFYLRSYALDIFTPYPDYDFYYIYARINGAYMDEEDPQIKSIEELADEVSSIHEGEDDVPMDKTTLKCACAVYQPETGETFYYPDKMELDTEEKDMISIRRAHAYPDDVRALPVFMSGNYNKTSGAGVVYITKSWNINCDTGYYELKFVTTVDYSKLYYGILFKVTAAIAVISVLFTAVLVADEKKRLKKIYAGCAEAVRDADDRRLQLAKELDTPINVIIGAAEGIRTAGDDRADNIIKNATIIKETLSPGE